MEGTYTTQRNYQEADKIVAEWAKGKTAKQVEILEKRLHRVREEKELDEITDDEMDFAQAMCDDTSESFVFEGLSTGYKTIDDYLLGVKPGDVVMLGGYTNLGKSTISLDWCFNFAQQGANVLYFALEDNEREMNSRGKALLKGRQKTPEDMKVWKGKFYRYPMAKKLNFFRNKFGIIPAIEALALTRNIQVVCLDMLNDIVDPVNDKDADDFMVALKEMCDRLNLILIATTRLREPKGLTKKAQWREKYAPDEDAIYGRGMIKYLATKIVTIAQSGLHESAVKVGFSGVETHYISLSICKNRTGGNTKRENKVITLQFNRGQQLGMYYKDLGAEELPNVGE